MAYQLKGQNATSRHSAQGADVTQSQNLLTAKWNSPVLFGLVALGGAIGSLLRYAVFQAFPTNYSFLGTLTVNVIGAFVLAFLLETLAKRFTETPRTQQIRTLIGTGICGGFTTYSTFMLDLRFLFVMSLFSARFFAMAIAYLAGTFILGALAVLLGIKLGAR